MVHWITRGQIQSDNKIKESWWGGLKLAKRVPNSNRIEDLLQVYMQPVFDIDKFSIVKTEALVRSRKQSLVKESNDATRAFELIRKKWLVPELDNNIENCM